MPLQQMMLFDALRHGSVRLNLEVNPDYLLMDNLYDNSERRFKEYEHPWDVAFYNGSYYSYFGSLPIVVFYEVFYILTGYLLLFHNFLAYVSSNPFIYNIQQMTN